MYTSGTESHPKAAMHTSRSLMWNYISTIVAGEMSGEDVEIHSLPLYHCAQLDNFLITDIYLGATSIILPRPEPEAVLRNIERYQVTNYFAPPTVWISLLRLPIFDDVDLSSLRKGYYGASAMPIKSSLRSGSAYPPCGCGTSTARPRWHHWRLRWDRTSRTHMQVRPGAPCSMWRRRSSTGRHPRGDGCRGRNCSSQPAFDAGLSRQ